jgi:4-amino-4-deoxy-L-arabinose transferase-like glycosyltransferase
MATRSIFSRHRDLWIMGFLLILSYSLFFYKSGDRYIWDPDEDEYALVNQEMVEDGHWIYPTANGVPYSIKPPLYNWLGSAISLIGGEVTEASSRLPSALFAAAGVLMTYLLGKLLFGYRAGLLAAMVLATTPLYIEQGRWIQIHLPGTVFLTATILCFIWGYKNEQRRPLAYLLMYVPLALGTLTTGPVAVVMPALIIGGYLLLTKDLWHIWRLRLGWGALIYLAIAAPWFVTVSMKKEYAEVLLVTTNLTRYFQTFVHDHPFYYYVKRMPPWFLPWLLYLPGAIIAYFKHLTPEEKKASLLPFLWGAGLLLFFSVSRTKREVYMITTAPALALIVGANLDWAASRFETSLFWRRCFVWPTSLTLVLLTIGALGLPAYAWFRAPDWVTVVLPITIMGVIAMACAFRFLAKRQNLAVITAIVLLLAGVVAYGARNVIAKVNEARSPRAFCQQINTIIPPDEDLRMFAFFRPAYGYYTHRRLILLHDPSALKALFTSGKRAYVVTKDEVYRSLKENFPVPVFVIYRQEVDGRDILLLSNQPDSKPS